jgi:aldehyde:ferredoxin oxidoreductase
VRVACIGAAGEAQIPFALILCDHGRVAGRTWMGAVMGSKNLKAIAVRGRRDIPLAEVARFQATRSRANRDLRDDTVTVSLRATGSAGGADYFDYLGPCQTLLHGSCRALPPSAGKVADIFWRCDDVSRLARLQSKGPPDDELPARGRRGR